jgi:uncharacterized protein YdaL
MKRSLLLLTLFLTSGSLHAKCVQIYYDRAPQDPKPFKFGRVHAMYVQNLMGHFPNYQQYVQPMDRYQKGDLDRCDANIYVATHYFSPQPQEFLDDYVSTKKNVLWAGYGIWKLGDETIKNLWKVKFLKLSEVLPRFADLTPAQQAKKYKPDFYKYYEYKGEDFVKYAEWDNAAKPDNFIAAYEISLFESQGIESEPYVLSWARHSLSGVESPYVLRNANHWYIAESPLSYMTEEDRYLIFADLLFDVLNEKPTHTSKKPALLRLEDVHPMVPIWQIRRMGDMFKRVGIQYAISLIPVFVDPLHVMTNTEDESEVPITASKEFVSTLEHARKNGASFVLHGFTHQYGKTANPFNGLSGDDFEFWDRKANTPIPGETVNWALDRLEDGMGLIDRANKAFGTQIKPLAWLTPHYQCSALTCTLFGQLWQWTIGRNIYFLHTKSGADGMPDKWNLDRYNPADRADRKKHLASLKVEAMEGMAPTGQFFPYEIYGDIYKQRVLPENVGNVQPYMNEQVLKTQTTDDLIRIMKRNRVLRDTWASWFVHPFRLSERAMEGVGEFPGDTAEVEKVVRAALDYGYEFIDLEKWVQTHRDTLRPEPIERDR